VGWFFVLGFFSTGRCASARFVLYLHDVLINRLRLAGLGCKMFQRFVGCLLYADDIILLSHSLNATRSMLKICEQFALDFDVKFNAMKSVVMRIVCNVRISVKYIGYDFQT